MMDANERKRLQAEISAKALETLKQQIKDDHRRTYALEVLRRNIGVPSLTMSEADALAGKPVTEFPNAEQWGVTAEHAFREQVSGNGNHAEQVSAEPDEQGQIDVDGEVKIFHAYRVICIQTATTPKRFQYIAKTHEDINIIAYGRDPFRDPDAGLDVTNWQVDGFQQDFDPALELWCKPLKSGGWKITRVVRSS